MVELDKMLRKFFKCVKEKSLFLYYIFVYCCSILIISFILQILNREMFYNFLLALDLVFLEPFKYPSFKCIPSGATAEQASIIATNSIGLLFVDILKIILYGILIIAIFIDLRKYIIKIKKQKSLK